HVYVENNGSLPYAYKNGYSWSVVLLPYIEQGPVYSYWTSNTAAGGLLSYNSVPAAGQQAQIATFYCPTRRAPSATMLSKAPAGALGDYAGNCGSSGECNNQDGLPEGVIFGTKAKVAPPSFTQISDGLSSTLLFGEKHLQMGVPFGQNDY